MAEDYFISLKLLCVARRAMLFYYILGATFSNETQSHFNQSFLHTFVRFPLLAAVVSCRHSQLFSRIHQKRSHSHAWYCAQLFYFIIGDILAGDVPHTVRRRSWFFCMSLPISIWCYDSCRPDCVCVCLYRLVVIFFCLLFTIFPFVFFIIRSHLRIHPLDFIFVLFGLCLFLLCCHSVHNLMAADMENMCSYHLARAVENYCLRDFEYTIQLK